MDGGVECKIAPYGRYMNIKRPYKDYFPSCMIDPNGQIDYGLFSSYTLLPTSPINPDWTT